VTDFLPHILPTLRSRFVMFEVGKVEEVKVEDSKFKSKKVDILSAEYFLSSEIDKRLAIVKDIHTGLDKETVKISDVWAFANKLENLVVEKRGEVGYKDRIEAIAGAQQYMHVPGNSVKMLLEYLAIRL